MGLHVGAGSGSDDTVLSEINVTPLVDVMLVLLVIFMVTAPMLHQGHEVALPEVESKNLPMHAENPLVISVNAEGLVYLMDEPVHESQLVERLTPIIAAQGSTWVLLKGDRSVPYGKVMEVIEILRQGGIEQVGLVTRPGGRRGRR